MQQLGCIYFKVALIKKYFLLNVITKANYNTPCQAITLVLRHLWITKMELKEWHFPNSTETSFKLITTTTNFFEDHFSANLHFPLIDILKDRKKTEGKKNLFVPFRIDFPKNILALNLHKSALYYSCVSSRIYKINKTKSAKKSSLR